MARQDMPERTGRNRQQKGRGGSFSTTKRSPFSEGSREPTGVGALNAILLNNAVVLTVKNGGMVSFGSVQGGGAVRVTLFDGDDKHTTYAVNAAEFDAAMTRIAEYWGTPPERVNE